MRYDREYEFRGRPRRYGRDYGRGGRYGSAYERPYGGYGGFHMGYGGGSLRSRGSFEAGQLRSGRNPQDEFEWGGGYVGGRGYGGTNYDLEHGYRTGAPQREQRRYEPEATGGGESSEATRGGYAWGEAEEGRGEPYGPARYGYGPYHDRLRRQRRDDDDIREEVEETLFYDTWVDADAITVEVEDGIVRLTGTLPNYEEVRFATDDAWDVDGVRGVRTELDVDESRDAGSSLRGRRGFAAGDVAEANEDAGEESEAQQTAD